MLVLRVFVYLAVIGLLVILVIYLVTRNPAYLRFAWQLIKFSTLLLLIIAAIFAMGRIILF